jgi:hypothetical protein
VVDSQHVAEQLLDGAQIGAALQEVAGERVPKGVRADAESRAATRHVARDQALHAAARQPASPRIHKHRIAFLSCDF